MLTARDGLTIALAFLGTAGAAPAVATEGNGLRTQADGAAWPRWQARLLPSSSFALWRHAAPDAVERRPITSLSLLGDYYVSRSPSDAPRSSGLRATSGLIVGSLSGQSMSGFEPGLLPGAARGFHSDPLDRRRGAGRLDSVPYVGIGYTSIVPKAGLGFSADIGLAARFGSAEGLRQALGAQSLEDTLREMRLTPLLSVGMSYSF